MVMKVLSNSMEKLKIALKSENFYPFLYLVNPEPVKQKCSMRQETVGSGEEKLVGCFGFRM